MKTPPASGSTFAVYALGFALTITALILDIRLGGSLFALAGFAGSLMISALLIYRAARAMAYSPAAARIQTVPVRVPPPDCQRIAA
jgi:hypothetical protein